MKISIKLTDTIMQIAIDVINEMSHQIYRCCLLRVIIGFIINFNLFIYLYHVIGNNEFLLD